MLFNGEEDVMLVMLFNGEEEAFLFGTNACQNWRYYWPFYWYVSIVTN